MRASEWFEHNDKLPNEVDDFDKYTFRQQTVEEQKMSQPNPLFATIGNIIDIIVTGFLMFKGFVWGGIVGSAMPLLLTGNSEFSTAVVVCATIGAVIGTIVGFFLSFLVTFALAPLYWKKNQ